MNKMRMPAGIGTPVLLMSLFFFVSDSWGQNSFTGRMTGGGSIFLDTQIDLVDGLPAPSGTRIAHGFQLHCGATNDPQNIVPPNNLELSVHLPDGQDHRFHLDELTNAICLMDSNISPGPPKNSLIYWYNGSGTGRYDGVAGYCADWVFTDEGEPGTDDRIVSLRIWSDCAAGTGFVLTVGPYDPLGGRKLTYGNHQALPAKGRK
jgi:hypothetical protein